MHQRVKLIATIDTDYPTRYHLDVETFDDSGKMIRFFSGDPTEDPEAAAHGFVNTAQVLTHLSFK